VARAFLLFWEWSIPMSRQVLCNVIFFVVALAGISATAMLQARQPVVSPGTKAPAAQQAGWPK
jgi:hypothetical protein